MVIRFQEERFAGFFDEAVPLLQRHFDEIARNKDRAPLAPNVPGYVLADERGALCICTARDDGELIGYAVYMVGPSDHYSTTIVAESDVYWLAPEHRNLTIGSQLFGFTEERLKLRGAVVMHTRFKLEHPAAGVLLAHLGHTPIETVVEKVIG